MGGNTYNNWHRPYWEAWRRQEIKWPILNFFPPIAHDPLGALIHKAGYLGAKRMGGAFSVRRIRHDVLHRSRAPQGACGPAEGRAGSMDERGRDDLGPRCSSNLIACFAAVPPVQ